MRYNNSKGVVNIFMKVNKHDDKEEKISFKKSSESTSKRKMPRFRSFIQDEEGGNKKSELSKSFRKTNSSNTVEETEDKSGYDKFGYTFNGIGSGPLDFNRDIEEKPSKNILRLSKSAHRVIRLKKVGHFPFKNLKEPKIVKKTKNNKKSKELAFPIKKSPKRKSISFGKKKRKRSVSERLFNIGKVYDMRRKSKEKQFYKGYFKPDVSVSKDSYKLSKKNFDIIKKIDAEIKRKNNVNKNKDDKERIKPMAKLKDLKKNVLGKKKKGKANKYYKK